jgi:hypothetical protein
MLGTSASWATAAAVCLHLTSRSAATADIDGIGDAQLVAADDNLGNWLQPECVDPLTAERPLGMGAQE